MIPPSPWLERYLYQIPKKGVVLDLACGSGRHARCLVTAGYRVLAVDRDRAALAELAGLERVSTVVADLEEESWPLAGQSFSGIVVANYLWRPRLPDLLAMLEPGGVLIYETFMMGNERYGKPARPDFLLQSQELLDVARGHGLTVLAYEEGYTDQPRPAMRQAVFAVRPG